MMSNVATVHPECRVFAQHHLYIPPSCINNPWNEFHPQFIPHTIFNLSQVDHLYIGRDTVVAFADKPAVDVYHVEISSDIGRTKLVKMDIDTGNSPPISSRPYTLPLKHYEWV